MSPHTASSAAVALSYAPAFAPRGPRGGAVDAALAPANDAPSGAALAPVVPFALCRQRKAARVSSARGTFAPRVSSLAARARCAPQAHPASRSAPMEPVREGAQLAPAWALSWRLSPRLADVAALVLAGLADKDVAARLQLSPTSVSTYVREVYRRAGVRSRAALLAAATQVSRASSTS